ncbi:alpha/beta fold hydrolase [Streptomyces sp. Li-HN-5-11]|uniref:thioesterase II family protein n=1 Tax=Streptomyces sp. Li-HN-5-11 TaxID=3075432 RepID=UPI0028A6FDD3|nr:alpha/beta fold hydrolase [Streptomyces sp. Li-HN-5-11]WNM30387.1 alpha/beta fold hydrolase [Streptomyces sp. Li-HN-5-11]
MAPRGAHDPRSPGPARTMMDTTTRGPARGHGVPGSPRRSSPAKWIRTFHPEPEAPARLLCFPHAGGSAGGYHRLSAALVGRAETLVVQYPGRQDRLGEPCAGSVEELVDGVLGELVPRIGDGRPLGLFGHSMGALVAFETAHRLQRLGAAPDVLFVSARRAPSLAEPTGSRDLPLDDEELVAELRRLGGIDDELLAEPGILRFALPAMRGDCALLDRYRYRPREALECAVVGVLGEADAGVGEQHMRPWSSETRGEYHLRVLPGGHFYLHEQLPRLTALIDDALSNRL